MLSKEFGLIIVKKSWPFFALVTAHLIWGANFSAAKITLQEIPPMTLSFIRFTLATILLLPFVVTTKKSLKVSRQDLPRFFAVGAFMCTLNIALFYMGIVRTTTISASVLTMTVPVFSVLMGWAFLKEKVYAANLVGIGLGLLGAMSVVGLPLMLFEAQPPSSNMLGNFLIVLASIFWVIGASISKGLLKKYTTLTLTFFIFLVGALSFAIPAANEYLQNPQWISKVTYVSILGSLYITILSSISAYFLFEWGVGKVGVIKADLFQYIQPLVAAAIGILILGEQPRVYQVLGSILIFLGVYWGTLAKEHHKLHHAHRS